MATRYVSNQTAGQAKGQDNSLVLADGPGNKYTLAAVENVGFVIERNGTRVSAPLMNVVAKAASYTVSVNDHGTFFTTEGAVGAITFTLPATASLPTGWYADFYNAAGQNMIVTAGTADTGVAFNDLAADSVGFTTVAELIGSHIRVVKLSGTLVGYVVSLASETVTPTIAT